MSRYYQAVNAKSSVRMCTIYRVCRTICQHTFSVPAHTSALKDKSVRLPTLAYVHTKIQKHTSYLEILNQKALLADPSDPKSKLTL